MLEQLSPEEITELRQLAAAGDVPLQYKLGLLFKQFPNLGSPNEAIPWLAMAAKNGHGEACWELAFIYIDAEWVAQDFQQARIWLTHGANLEHGECLYCVARPSADAVPTAAVGTAGGGRRCPGAV